jgi:hypothetical protein
MKIKIFEGNWQRKDVLGSRDIFVFGDNNARVGKGGQAVIRGLDNTFGIRTKIGPNNKPLSFYNDKDLKSNIQKIDDDVLRLKKLALEGNTIVFSSGGYGTGLSKLPEVAPQTFNHLCNILLRHFKFDNRKGTKYNRVPGYDELMDGKYLNLINSNKEIIQPVNNGLFIPEHLNAKIYTVEKLIQTERKTAFTSKVKYKEGEVLKIKTFGSNKYIVARVISNYRMVDISRELWSFFDGYRHELLNDVNLNQYYQVHFEYISTLSQDGTINFKGDLFSTNASELKSKESNKNINIDSDDKIKKLLKEVEDLKKKVNDASNNKKKVTLRSFLGLDISDSDIIKKKGISGTFTKVSVINPIGYTYYKVENTELTHYIRIKKWFLFNRVDTIISLKNT